MAFGGQLFVHLRAKPMHEHDLDPQGLDQRQILRNRLQLACRNGFTGDPHHKSLVAELVDIGCH
ncbi:hypothetical protein D3C72_1230230 [compost metagenome]